MAVRRFLIVGLVLISNLVLAQPQEIITKKGKLTIHPVLHSSMVLEWNGQTIYVDPYGGKEKYESFADPTLVIITDIHGDHMNKETLQNLNTSNATLLAPKAVTDQMEDIQFSSIKSLANGEKLSWEDISFEAIPMYNLPETEDSRHPKGRGNGYIISVGGKRLYISGDTEDIEEMRNLKKIDIAFVCMNLPYTMDINQAADAVLAFKPKVVYPFHYRGGGGKFSDTEAFKALVNKGNDKIEVRLLDWYAN